EGEALKLLATLDPLAAMAESDPLAIGALVTEIETESAALRAMLDELVAADLDTEGPAPLDGLIVPATFQVVVECPGEAEQREVYERLVAEGFRCRVLSL